MAADYWVLVADELMTDEADRIDWASVELEVIDRGRYEGPGMRWWKFRDENADPGLEGRQVELTISRVDGHPVIAERRITGDHA
jgi:hypothetical protein